MRFRLHPVKLGVEYLVRLIVLDIGETVLG
jgi:hypothetical protein